MSEADRYFIKKGFSKVIKQGIEEFTDDDGNYIHFDLVIERFTCNCYLSAKELQAINKKVEELRMDMSNKTSDKNVGSIEEDIRILQEKDCMWHYPETRIEEAISNILADYTRQKQINEEHQKINGELREKVKELDTKNDELLKDLYSANCIIADLTDSIPKQKIKDLLTEIQEEYNKLDKEIDKQIKDKNKDYYKCKENIAIMQTLAYCRDKFEGLLEEK